jgi:hypothetical protein
MSLQVTLLTKVTSDGCMLTSLDLQDVFAGDAVDKGDWFIKSKPCLSVCLTLGAVLMQSLDRVLIIVIVLIKKTRTRLTQSRPN